MKVRQIYKHGDHITTAMLNRFKKCTRTIDYFCGVLGTTVAHGNIANCQTCGCATKEHRRATLCDVTQEAYWLSQEQLHIFENRCTICSRELREHNSIDSNSSIRSRNFKLRDVFKKH